jgi:transportin-3
MRQCTEQLCSPKAISDAPDTADDTFLLAGRALGYCPGVVLRPNVLPSLLDCALAGILIQHR